MKGNEVENTLAIQRVATREEVEISKKEASGTQESTWTTLSPMLNYSNNERTLEKLFIVGKGMLVRHHFLIVQHPINMPHEPRAVIVWRMRC
jgi:hypothetical protein